MSFSSGDHLCICLPGLGSNSPLIRMFPGCIPHPGTYPKSTSTFGIIGKVRRATNLPTRRITGRKETTMSTTIYDRILAEMPTGLERATLRVLSFHQGKQNAIGRESLVDALRSVGFDVKERLVRRCIHDLRRAGHLICSTPGEDGGYHLAGNRQEFDEFCERELHPKAIDMLETESAMKKAAGQLFGDASQPQLI